MLDADQYRLPADEHARIFRTFIVPHVFESARPVDQPVAILFGGQPGAGKSRTIDHVLDEFADRGGAVQIIGDDLRTFHPAYAALLDKDDKTAAFYTDRDSGKWIEMCIAHARQLRVNVVIEGTMRNSDVVASTAADFRAAGYRVDARALAVNFKLSEQGILLRYERQKQTRGSGRMTTEAAHRAAYDGMEATLDRLEREKLVDQVTLYQRGAEILYVNTLDHGEWRHPAGAVQALTAERARPMTLQEHQDYVAVFDRLVEMQGRPERAATDGERAHVLALRASAQAGLVAEIRTQVASTLT